ncbi:MAG: Entericidin EcnA/B family protein [Planctomycetes bacterium]|nr:Entericidin EcnA/B family protein [Planctomycetota bacterium]
MVKKIFLVAALTVLMFAFFGCQTVKGLGRDITSAGEAGEELLEKP